jgi:hypothetical protein
LLLKLAATRLTPNQKKKLKLRKKKKTFYLPNIRICLGNCSLTSSFKFSNGTNFNETRLATAETPLSVRAAR